MTKQRVKLSDIAQKTDVSISTVHLVLRQQSGIPPETRQRVLKTAQNSVIASGLRQFPTFTDSIA